MLNVADVMKTWIEEKGYPVITAQQTNRGLLLRQERFLSSPDLEGENDTEITNKPSKDYRWIVPITVMTNNKSHSLYWMNSTSLIIPEMKEVKWYKVNINQTGFYRVKYDPYGWSNLFELLERGPDEHILSPTDRANLIDDAFSFMFMGDLEPSIALNITSRFKTVVNLVTNAHSNMNLFCRLLDSTQRT